MNKKIKLILEAVVICIILFSVFYTGFMAYSKRLTYDKMKADNSSYTSIETIDDQEIHIDGFPVIYIEGNNEIYKDNWETFSSELQKYCNIPWLTKNVSSIHYCSEDVFYNAMGEKLKKGTWAGFAKSYDNSIYILETGDAGYDETIVHEFGHIYDFTYGITSNYDISILKENQNKVCENGAVSLESDHCLSDCEETFADAIRLYTLYPEAGYLPEEVFNWIDTLPR